jgi:hypothetical protein
MSIKITIAHGDDWHLFEDCISDQIYIDAPCDFVATPQGVVVQIKSEVIDAIRAARPNCFPHLRGTVDGAEVMQ